MRKVIVFVILVVGAGGIWFALSKSNPIKPGLVFDASPNYMVCPTKETAVTLDKYVTKNDADAFKKMLVGSGGVCLDIYAVKWKVVHVEGNFVGIRLADLPDSGTMWAPVGIIASVSPIPSNSN